MAMVNGKWDLCNNVLCPLPDRTTLHETTTLALLIDLRLDNHTSLIQRYGEVKKAQILTDTELLLNLFELYGLKVLEHVRGGYAGCVFDRRNNTLAFFRDPMGERPLFYTLLKDNVGFASSLPLILKLPGIEKRPNRDILADYALHNFTDRENTPFKGIFRVPPGCVVSIDCRGNRSVRYFHDWKPRKIIILPSRRDYAEAVREKLTTAVLRRIQDAGQVGSHLSSGLDSGTVACLAARMLHDRNQQLQGFTWVPANGYRAKAVRGRYCDERYLARAIARKNGNIRMHLARSPKTLQSPDMDSRFFFMAAPDLLRMNGWYETIMKQAGDMGINVMLAGFMGNFSFSHNSVYSLAHQIRQRDLKGIIDFWKHTLDVDPGRLFRMAGYQIRQRIRKGPKNGWAPVSDDYTVARAGTRRMDAARERARNAQITAFFENRVEDRFLFRCQAALGGSWWADYWFHMETLYGVTMRDPTADLDLMEFCLAIPESQFIGRGVARRLGRGLLPARVVYNRQRGLQNGDWQDHFSRSVDHLTAEAALLETCELANEMLDVKKLKGLLAKWPPSDSTSDKTSAVYRFAVFRGIKTGTYLRWLEHFCG